MTDYYVRKTGSNSNDGTNPDTEAWLTIDFAASTIVAGDTVYVGAGVYREQVTLDASGSSGSPIQYIADVSGEKTGDAGLVVITPYDNEYGLVTRTWAILMAAKDYITLRGFVIVTGNTAGIGYAQSVDYGLEGWIIEDCAFISGGGLSRNSIELTFDRALTPVGDGAIIRRCIFFGAGISLNFVGPISERNLKMSIESCVAVGGYGYTSFFEAWEFLAGVAHTGGVDITNCTIIGYFYGVRAQHPGISTTYPINVRNCYLSNVSYAIYKETTNDGALTSDYNTIFAEHPYTNVTPGANDKIDTDQGRQLLGGIHDMHLHRLLGFSPYKPFEPIRLNDDSYISPLIGTADSAVAPANDLYDLPRPMHGTVDARGAVESRSRAEKETTTVRTGSNAIRFDGAGHHDMLMAVSPTNTAIIVYGRYNSSYAGTLPQVKIMNIPGDTDKIVTMTGGANQWEQLVSVFQPTSQGIAVVRLISNDTSAGGQCFFDDLERG